MILRPVQPGDLDALAAVHAASFSASWSAAELHALTGSPGALALLAQDAAPFAFVLIRAVAGEAEVLTIAVDPGYRGQGAGAALMAAAMAQAQAAGAETLFLEVADDNAPARALYARLGFEAAGLRRGYYKRSDSPAVDALVLRRNLNKPAD